MPYKYKKNREEIKLKQLKELYEKHNLNSCPVNTNICSNPVWGEGNPDARLLLIGEAPGREEDIKGLPFVGRSGKLLKECLKNANIPLNDVFITNIVKCRPPNNRMPSLKEITFYKPILLNEIQIINPLVICTLGATALKSLIQQKLPITKIRGAPLFFNAIKLIPTLHPAYILRNPQAQQYLINDLALAYAHTKKAVK